MRKADIKIVVGPTGCGKTDLVDSMVFDCDRLIVFDPMGNGYSDGIVFYDIEQLKKFWLNVYKGSFRIIYRPLNEVADYVEICNLAMMCGNLTMVAEEMDLYYPPQGTTIEAKSILRRGRHRDIHFIGCSQRPVGIDKNITSMATEAFIFQTYEPRDVQYLRERFGDEIVERMIDLKEYEYVHCTDGKQSKEIRGGNDGR